MTELITPDVGLHASWAAAMGEFQAEGPHVHGAGLWMLPEDQRWDLTEAGCRRLVDALLAGRSPIPDGSSVPCHFLWVGDGSTVVGTLALRIELNAWLLEEGGHIGYAIAPSHRRQGHASRALGLAVRRAAGLGIDRVLVTCDEPNLASARTIEANGGVWEDTRNGKRRYWIAT